MRIARAPAQAAHSGCAAYSSHTQDPPARIAATRSARPHSAPCRRQPPTAGWHFAVRRQTVDLNPPFTKRRRRKPSPDTAYPRLNPGTPARPPPQPSQKHEASPKPRLLAAGGRGRARAAEGAWRPGGAAMFVARSIAADHRDLIHDVSFDFHGRRMATCSSDQSVKVGAAPGGPGGRTRPAGGAAMAGRAWGRGAVARTSPRCGPGVPRGWVRLMRPHGRQLPRHSRPTRGPRSRAGNHGLCLLQASSAAAPRAPPWLHGQICSARCPRAAGGRPAPLRASPGLRGAAAACLELLLPSFCTDLGACRAALSHLSALSPSRRPVTLFPFLKSALQEHNQHHSRLSSGSSGSLLEQLEL